MAAERRITQHNFQPPYKGEVVRHGDQYYTLGKPIGNGSFGAVYECWDEWGNKLVAKILLPQSRTYEEVRKNWIDELQKLKELRHPNITYVYDAFEYKDTFYLIIERCAKTLKELLESSDFNTAELVRPVARDILQGLHFIHNQNYVHKDIHAGNIFIAAVRDHLAPKRDPILVFKIGDLGITRLASEIALNTILAQWMLPPESFDPREFGPIGKHMDIYHTGLMLLSMFLGYLPNFTKEQILSGYPRELAAGLDSPYAPAIAHALRRHVKSRTPSALDFWRELNK